MNLQAGAGGASCLTVQQARQLLNIVAITHPIVAQAVAVIPELLDGGSGVHPLTRRRSAMRASSNTTTAPFSRDCATAGRFFASGAVCLSGRRSAPRRNRIEDGFVSRLSASKAPKPVNV